MADKDITNLVNFGDNDGEALPITQCACGATFKNWDFVVGTRNGYRNYTTCPECGRQMYFEVSIRVFEVEKGEE